MSTTPSSPPIEFVDSGRFKPGRPVAEPVHHDIGPFPAKLPCRIHFDMVGGTTSATDHESRVINTITESSKARAKLHLDGEFYVLQNGLLVRRLGPIDYVMSLFAQDMPTVTFNVLFQSTETVLSAAHLPKRRHEPIVNPSSGYALTPWKLCLGLPGHDTYHDHVFWEPRGLYLQSVRDAWEKQ